MRIATKLTGGFLLVAAVIPALGWFMLQALALAVHSFREVEQDNIPAAVAMAAVERDAARLVAEAEGFLLSGERAELEEYRQARERLTESFGDYELVIQRAPLPEYQEMVEEMSETLEGLRKSR
jgi:CHASE3 domain sensor protein